MALLAHGELESDQYANPDTHTHTHVASILVVRQEEWEQTELESKACQDLAEADSLKAIDSRKKKHHVFQYSMSLAK